MPRRGRSFPMRAPSRPASNLPARAPPRAPAHPPAQQPKQPGLFANMASTAAGVAVGSTVGHVIGGSIMGGGGGSGGGGSGGEVQQYSQDPGTQQQEITSPCQMELQQFLQCAQDQSDINLCYGFNEALKECKMRNGPGMQ